jgi:Protein of unknown function (DUF3040)
VVSMNARDKVALSETERLALAGLEASTRAEDPRLADRLRRGPTLRWMSRPPWSSWWLSVLLVVAGLGAVLGTVAVSVWAASAAAMVLTAGLWLAAEGYQTRKLAKADRESGG